MRRMIAIITLLLGAFPALADDWAAMSGPEINAALTDAKVIYEDGWQSFHANGRTLYVVGPESWGNWQVQGDQYCSQWPPSNHWDCYDMTQNISRSKIRFISPGGRVFEGVLEAR